MVDAASRRWRAAVTTPVLPSPACKETPTWRGADAAWPRSGEKVALPHRPTERLYVFCPAQPTVIAGREGAPTDARSSRSPSSEGLRPRRPRPPDRGRGCASETPADCARPGARRRSEEHTSELQSRLHLVCRLLLEKKKKKIMEAHKWTFSQIQRRGHQ